MVRTKTPIFYQTALAFFISSIVAPAFASGVRDDVDYQIFRDFAENKGKFTVGNTDPVPIFDKSGHQVGAEIVNAPMIDFSSTDLYGIGSLVTNQHFASVAHNGGYQDVKFGTIRGGNNLDDITRSYKLVNRYDTEDFNGPNPKHQRFGYQDYHLPRLGKWVTEVAPMPISKDKNLANLTQFARRGSGTQKVCAKGGAGGNVCTDYANPYQYLIGGHPLTPPKDRVIDNGTWVDRGRVFGNDYGPLVNVPFAGDSGSPVYGYDPVSKTWGYIGALQASFGNDKQGQFQRHIVGAKPEYLDFIEKREDAGTLQTTANNETVTFSVVNGKGQVVGTNGNSLKFRLAEPNPYPRRPQKPKDMSEDEYKKTLYAEYVKKEQAYRDGQHVHLAGERGTLVLNQDLNQGAGGIYFETDYRVQSKAGSAFNYTGAGVDIADGKQVDWMLNLSKSDDILSKVGKGTLNFTPATIEENANLGTVSVGDGTLLLNQNANGKAYQYRVEIVSGRPTVQIGENSDASTKLNDIYFGFRGGKLDLNGHSGTVDRIHHVDDGATIYNSNLAKTSNLTIRGNKILKATDLISPTVTNAQQDYDNNHDNFLKVKNAEGQVYDYYVQNPHWANSGGVDWSKTVLIYNPTAEQWRANRDLDGFWGFDNDLDRKGWEVIGKMWGGNAGLLSDGITAEKMKKFDPTQIATINKLVIAVNKQYAITPYQGYFGKTGAQGELNVTFEPTVEGRSLLLTGGSQSKGDLNVNKGTVLLQGQPTPHALAYKKSIIPIIDDDYQNPRFAFRAINVADGATFRVGRNVESVKANLNLASNASAKIGFDKGDKAYWVNPESGFVLDATSLVTDKGIQAMPATDFIGDITMAQGATLTLGEKANFTGSVQGASADSITMHQNARWNMTENSDVANLNLNGNVIVLNAPQPNQPISLFASRSATPAMTNTKFNTLTINGNLSGDGEFIYTTNVTRDKGDKVIVNGDATGNLTLTVDNTGTEPSEQDLPLLDVKGDTANLHPTLKNGHVDLGAYRYTLQELNGHHNFVLLSAEGKKAAIKKREDAEKAEQERIEKARQEAEAKRKAEEEKAKADAEKARQEAEAKRKAEEEKAKAEAEKARQEAEAKRKAEEKAKADAEKARQEAEAKRKAEEEKAKAEAEKARQEAEAKRKAEEEKAKAEAEKARQEAEAKRKAEEEKAKAEQTNKPKQADVISRYSNVALSEYSAQVNALLQLDNTLDMNLIAPQMYTLRLWANHHYQKTVNASDNYRAYRQQFNLTQLGVEKTENQRSVAVMLSQGHSRNDYDDGVRGTTKQTSVSLLMRQGLGNGVMIAGDLSYTYAKHHLDQSNADSIERNIGSAGLMLSKQWQWGNATLLGGAGTRYHYLPEITYNYQGASIQADRMHLWTYQAVAGIAYNINAGGFVIRPEMNVHYVDASHANQGLFVNQHKLQQNFGETTSFDLGVGITSKQWTLKAKFGQAIGHQIDRKPFANLRIDYRW